MVKKYGRKTLEQYTKVEDNSTTEKAAVRCCKETEEKVDGAKVHSWTCTSPKGCPKGKKYKEAEEICKKLNMKICTKRQIATGICCGTGCMFDGMAVWTLPPKN